jgi:hypothetical protein
MTLPMIGKLLGPTQVQTMQRYAHLLDDPLRAGLEQVGDLLTAKHYPGLSSDALVSKESMSIL